MENTLINNKLDYLIDNKEIFFDAVKKAQNIILFLDYDGTLIPFKNNPNEVHTPNNVLQLIQKLSEKSSIKIVVITGRSLNDIKHLISINRISFAAVHGIHIQFFDGKEKILKNIDEIKIKLNQIKEALEKTLKNIDGVIIEDKQYSIAFHYRMVKEENLNDSIQKFKQTITKYFDDNIEIMKGDKVFEVRPKGWNKGNAVEFFLHKTNLRKDSLPIYIGDDTTDEDAFKYLKNKGLTVFVKNNSALKTNAHYWVNNPSEVYDILCEISEIKK